MTLLSGVRGLCRKKGITVTRGRALRNMNNTKMTIRQFLEKKTNNGFRWFGKPSKRPQ